MNIEKKFKKQCNTEITNQGKSSRFHKLTQEWIKESIKTNYSYHFSYLGRPIIQYPQDIVFIQELIWEKKPDLIIETGIAHGGSIIMSAALLAMIDMCEIIKSGKSFKPSQSKRKVLAIDIDIRSHNKKAILNHPMSSRIEMIEDSSISPSVIEYVHKKAKKFKNILVFLDSNHTHDHVLKELQAYAPLTSIGSYCIVFDSIIEKLPKSLLYNRPWGKGDNPHTAIFEYLKDHSEFKIDKNIDNKLMITVAPNGFLKRIK